MAKRAKLRKAWRKKRRSGPGTAKAGSGKKISVFRAPKGIPRKAPIRMSYNAKLFVQPCWNTTSNPLQHLSGIFIDASSLNPKVFVKFGHDKTLPVAAPSAVDGVFEQMFPKSNDSPNQSTMRGMDHIQNLYDDAYIDSSEIEFRIRLAPGQQPNLHNQGGAVSYFNDYVYGTCSSESEYQIGTTIATLRAQPTLKRVSEATPSTGEVRTITLKAQYNPRKKQTIAHPSDCEGLQFGTAVAPDGARQPQCADKTFFFLGYLPSHGLTKHPYGIEDAQQFPKFFLDYRIKYNVMYHKVKAGLTRSELPGFWWQSRWKTRNPYMPAWNRVGHDEL